MKHIELHKILAVIAIALLAQGRGVASTPTPHGGAQSSRSQTASNGRPTVVVGIAIEDFQPEYLQTLYSNLCQNGLRRFVDNGVLLTTVDYGTPLDFTAALAMLHTGTTPAVNGIPSARIYNRETMRTDDVFNDTGVMGNFTNETLSPTAITVSTLTDELRIAGDGVTHAYSIAPDPAPAIVQGGHAAGASIWLNRKTGNWASSTYYADMPNIVTQRNRLTPLSARIDTMKWVPMHTADYYPGLPDHLTHYPFRYTFAKGDTDKYNKLANTPLINTETTNIAIEMFKSLSLGQHQGGIDVLNIAYTLTPYDYTKRVDNRFELMDAYYRLDADIERLVGALESLVGRDNVLIWIAATPMSQTARRDDSKWRIPYGEYSPNRAMALLNMYLMAIHGNGEWVLGFSDGDFYLNTKLITDRGKDILTIRAQTAEFLRRMTGVSEVYTIDDIAAGNAGEHGPALRRNTSVRHSGDVRITLLPGWHMLDDSATGHASERGDKVHREAAPTAPLMIWHHGITPAVITTPVDARTIAPTISGILKVRTPNAANQPPIDIH